MMRNLFILLLFIPTIIFSQNVSVKERGYFNYTSLGSLIGSDNDGKTHIASLLMEHNYLFNKHFSAGIATGVEWLDVTVAPVGPNIKFILPGANTALYLGASGGYAFALEDIEIQNYNVIETKGGGFFNTELGYIFPDMGDFNFFVAIGYRYQEFTFIRDDWYFREVERKTTYNRLSLKIGVRLF